MQPEHRVDDQPAAGEQIGDLGSGELLGVERVQRRLTTGEKVSRFGVVTNNRPPRTHDPETFAHELHVIPHVLDDLQTGDDVD